MSDELVTLEGDRAMSLLDRDKARELLLWTYGGREVDRVDEVLDQLESFIAGYSQEDFDEHTGRAYREGAGDALREADRVHPGPGPRGREGWKQRAAEKFGLVEE